VLLPEFEDPSLFWSEEVYHGLASEFQSWVSIKQSSFTAASNLKEEFSDASAHVPSLEHLIYMFQLEGEC